MQIKGFLLDIDGTLLDSEPIHLRAWRQTLAAHGIQRSDEQIIHEFGHPTFEIARALVQSPNETWVRQIAREKSQVYMDLIPTIPLFPKVQMTLQKIKDLDGRICFVSSTTTPILNYYFQTFGWDRWSRGFVGVDHVVNPKPHPDMVLKAIEMLELRPNQCVMIGDSRYDLQAGRTAGTYTIGVCSGISNASLLKEFGASLVLEQFGDLYEHLPLELD